MQSHDICFTIVLASFLFFIILSTLTFASFILLGTHIFPDKQSTEIQPPLHLSKLIMNGLYLSSIQFKSTRKCLIIHGLLFNDTHFVAKNQPILNNAINTCIISSSIILFYFELLNNFECLICQIYQ